MAELKNLFTTVQQEAWEDAHAGWGEKKNPVSKKKISLESLNCIWTLISQRCGKLIKMIMSVFHFLPLSNIHVIGYLPLYLRDLMKNNKCR